MSPPNTSPQYLSPSTMPYQVIVLGAGVASTVAALIAVYFVNTKGDLNVMGWYVNYVLPAGAMLVGLVAGSGYGIASWFTGLKIQRRLLVMIVVLQLVAYFAAQYLIFVSYGPLALGDDGRILTFPEYYDHEARNFAWKQEGGKTGEALGEWGYVFRGLEVAGFALGALIVPAALFKKPYCDNCKVYMRTRELAVVGASVQARKVKKGDVAGQTEYANQQDQMFAAAERKIKTLCDCGAAGDIAGYGAALADLSGSKRAAMKLPKRIGIKLTRCTRCDSAYLQTRLITGQGKKISSTDLGRVDLPQGFASQVSS